jgi:hypothetical protein
MVRPWLHARPGLFWPELLPGSGELQYRDGGGRELEPGLFERIRITASPGAGERAYRGHKPGRQANAHKSVPLRLSSIGGHRAAL